MKLLPSGIESKFVQVKDLNLHYLEAGEGEVLLLLHGWPTSSWLYRDLMPKLSENNRVIALDLPGFGLSDKRIEDSFSFNYYLRHIDGFLEALSIDKISLTVHDLGGPIGMLWAVRNQERLQKLVLLNTLVFPEMSWMVKLFGLATVMPLVNTWLAGPAGIRFSMRFGVQQKEKLTPEVLKPYQEPFVDRKDRKVLLKAIQRMSPKGFKEIAQKLPELKHPVRLIYGENDRILPDVAQTMARVKEILPQSEMSSIPNCGHFLQEEVAEEIADEMLKFMKA
ncbi:MAG: alpha/beta fold hydrolase [Bacteroidia bacterium]|nr:alpha/beta fold hydrolase [Bacteroidia bacterium]